MLDCVEFHEHSQIICRLFWAEDYTELLATQDATLFWEATHVGRLTQQPQRLAESNSKASLHPHGQISGPSRRELLENSKRPYRPVISISLKNENGPGYILSGLWGLA